MDIIVKLNEYYNNSETFICILNHILIFSDPMCKKCSKERAITTKETDSNLCKNCYEDEKEMMEYLHWKFGIKT